ncbi:hypothetical protein DL93DRAFT_2091619 [Clavulina sp. PMI_390]|nr:hypothetical protein DL93DRAFT_2091619 [Clavulina sp. PMI_390]
MSRIPGPYPNQGASRRSGGDRAETPGSNFGGQQPQPMPIVQRDGAAMRPALPPAPHRPTPGLVQVPAAQRGHPYPNGIQAPTNHSRAPNSGRVVVDSVGMLLPSTTPNPPNTDENERRHCSNPVRNSNSLSERGNSRAQSTQVPAKRVPKWAAPFVEDEMIRAAEDARRELEEY